MQSDCIALVQDALFAVDKRIFSVRRKAQHRDLAAVLPIIEHIAVVRLFVQAEEQTHPAVQRDAEVSDGFQRKQTGHHRAFVVDGAAAIQLVVHDLRAIGRMMPALTLGHDVQMAQHGHHLVAGTDLTPADVAVKVGRLKAQLLTEGQSLGITGIHGFAKGLSGQFGRFHALLADQPLQGSHHLRPQGRNGFVQLLVHRAMPSRESLW